MERLVQIIQDMIDDDGKRAALSVVCIVTTCFVVSFGVGRYYVAPLTVLYRKLRPIAAFVGVIGWSVYRLCGGSTSLWQLLVRGMEKVSTYITNDEWPWWLTGILTRLWPLAQDLLVLLWLSSVLRVLYCLRNYSIAEWRDMIVHAIFEFSSAHVPMVKAELSKHKAKTRIDMQDALGKDPNRTITRVLPKQGRDMYEIIMQITRQGHDDNTTWQTGKVSGAVYAHDKEHTKLMNAAYSAFSWSNPLHPGLWPSVNQFEAEVISMTAHLMGSSKGDEIVGTTTSGGTESIVLAIKAHRELYGRQRFIRHPELICGPTAHAAVDKACELLGIRKVVVPCDPVTFTLQPCQVQKHITSNTILIYASAPSYPQGVIDPIEELSKIAIQYDIGLHVDACLGGFVLPFCKQLDPSSIPKFDFADCPGVTSMSVDTHKYAYASKGTSVVLYRHEELRHAQYFAYAKWTGGMYSTPTIAGSRPGGLLACAWAALVSIGESGYRKRVASILQTSKRIADGISEMADLYVLGTQRPTMVVCFSSDTVDIYRIGDMMEKRGWSLNALQHPACLHICVTLNTVSHERQFLSDLQQSVEQVKKEGSTGKTKGTAAIYGMAGSIPAGPVNELLKCFTDMTLTP